MQSSPTQSQFVSVWKGISFYGKPLNMTKQIDLNFSIRNTWDVVMSSSRPKKGANVAKVSTTNTLTLHSNTHSPVIHSACRVVWPGEILLNMK